MTLNPATTKNNIIIGLGEMAVSKTPGEVIKTLGLGSCVAVIALCPAAKAVGMVHIVLPDSNVDPDKAQKLPGYFVDTGIDAFFAEMKKVGMVNPSKALIKLVGGAHINYGEGHVNHFDIGKRNALAIKKKLWSLRCGVRSEDVGKDISRTVSVDVNHGKVVVTHKGQSWQI